MRCARRFFPGAVVTLCLLILYAMPAGAQLWVSTATKAVGPQLLSAVPQGLLVPSTPLHIVVGLKLRNQSSLVQFVQAANDSASPFFGSTLTVDQFVASYAPTAAQVASVVSYLTANGFSNIQAEPNNLMVTADGTPVQVQSAFNTLL